MIRKLLALTAALTIPAVIAGCGTSNDAGARNPDPKPATTATNADAKHEHKAGLHGGLVVEIGQRDSYHAEVVLEKEGVVRICTLDKDDGKVLEVNQQKLAAYVKVEGGMESVPVAFEPAPLPEDAKGKTSQFVGKLPKEFWGKPVTVTVPITIAEHRYRFSFTLEKGGHAEDMPVGITDDEDRRKLYLTPGGIYTEKDIEANGNTTPWQKFKFRSAHDMNPKPGDKVCPINQNTKADLRLSWVVGGKTYNFCCPPCVDEFVGMAKEEPGKIKEPGDYTKK